MTTSIIEEKVQIIDETLKKRSKVFGSIFVVHSPGACAISAFLPKINIKPRSSFPSYTSVVSDI